MNKEELAQKFRQAARLIWKHRRWTAYDAMEIAGVPHAARWEYFTLFEWPFTRRHIAVALLFAAQMARSGDL